MPPNFHLPLPFPFPPPAALECPPFPSPPSSPPPFLFLFLLPQLWDAKEHAKYLNGEEQTEPDQLQDSLRRRSLNLSRSLSYNGAPPADPAPPAGGPPGQAECAAAAVVVPLQAAPAAAAAPLAVALPKAKPNKRLVPRVLSVDDDPVNQVPL